jgi:hypothetical protein
VEAGEKAVEPPILATHEAVHGGINIGAAQVTWLDKTYDERNGESVRALELGTHPEFGENLRQGVTSNLNAGWFLNKLFMPQNYDKTAYEAQRLHDEFLRSVLPIIEPAEAERNGNHLELVLQKTIDMGLWGDMEKEMPKELRGKQIDFAYDNPIQDARKQEATFAYKAAAEVNAIAAQTSPKVLAAFNGEVAYRDAIMGVAPATWLLSEDEAAEAMAEAEQEQTMTEAAGEAAQVAETAAKVMPKMQEAA